MSDSGLGRGGGVISPGVAGLLIAGGLSMPATLLFFAVPTFAAAFLVLLIKTGELQ